MCDGGNERTISRRTSPGANDSPSFFFHEAIPPSVMVGDLSRANSSARCTARALVCQTGLTWRGRGTWRERRKQARHGILHACTGQRRRDEGADGSSGLTAETRLDLGAGALASALLDQVASRVHSESNHCSLDERDDRSVGASYAGLDAGTHRYQREGGKGEARRAGEERLRSNNFPSRYPTNPPGVPTRLGRSLARSSYLARPATLRLVPLRSASRAPCPARTSPLGLFSSLTRPRVRFASCTSERRSSRAARARESSIFRRRELVVLEFPSRDISRYMFEHSIRFPVSSNRENDLQAMFDTSD